MILGPPSRSTAIWRRALRRAGEPGLRSGSRSPVPGPASPCLLLDTTSPLAPPGSHPIGRRWPGHGRAAPERYFGEYEDQRRDGCPSRHADGEEGHAQQADPQHERHTHQDDTRKGPAISSGSRMRRTRRRDHDGFVLGVHRPVAAYGSRQPPSPRGENAARRWRMWPWISGELRDRDQNTRGERENALLSDPRGGRADTIFLTGTKMRLRLDSRC